MADNDAAFCEALDEYGRWCRDGDFLRQHDTRARVLALYAESSRGMTPEESAQYKAFLRSRFQPAERQGEVYEVQVIRSEYDSVGIVLDDDGYSPGDKVRVTKVEEG